MTDLVSRTLSNWRSTPFVWGDTDCLLSVGAYLLEATGNDWTTPFRGRYNDADGAAALIAEYGGEIEVLDTTGMLHTLAPKRGDVILAKFGPHIVAGLHTGNGAAFRMETGVIEYGASFVKIICAWSVE